MLDIAKRLKELKAGATPISMAEATKKTPVITYGGIPLCEQTKPYRVVFHHPLSPGDVVVLTAAIYSLHKQFPGDYLTGVECTSAQEIFANNPHISRLPHNNHFWFRVNYNAINTCNQDGRHFIDAFCDDIAAKLNIQLVKQINHPVLFLTEEEKRNIYKWDKMVICNFGGKTDYTTKIIGNKIGKEIVDWLLSEGYTPIQIGHDGNDHRHTAIPGAVNMIGRTTMRELIKLCYHSVLGIGNVTLIQHIFAAFRRPYICLQSREPTTWIGYSNQKILHQQGILDCCSLSGKPWACWKDRVVPLNDGDVKDLRLCSLPVLSGNETIPSCIANIGSEGVIAAIKEIL